MNPGGHSDRFRGPDLPQVTARDPLPTAEIVLAAKRNAARICGARAADVAWPDLDAAKAWVVARCVGLDPLDGPDALLVRRADDRWPAVADAILDVVLASGGGR